MKIHDFLKTEGGFSSPKMGGIKLGRSLSNGPCPTDAIVKYLNSVLDNRFHLLCNYGLRSKNEQVPIILVGPTGIWLIQAFASKGVFEINGVEFLRQDEKRGDKKLTKLNTIENLLKQTAELQGQLSGLSPHAPLVEPVLFLTHPGAHVQLNQPAVKIVMLDTTNQFVSKVITNPVIYNGESIQLMVDQLILRNNPVEDRNVLNDGFSVREDRSARKSQGSSKSRLIDPDEPELITRISEHLPFSKRQWIILSILVVVNLIVLIALILFVIKNAGV